MKKGLLAGFLSGTILALFVLGLSFILPSFITRGYDQKSLARLKIQSLNIRSEFTAVLTSQERLLKRLQGTPSFQNAPELFNYIRKLGLRSETEGVAFYNPGGRLFLWLGNVIDLEDRIRPSNLAQLSSTHSPFLVRDKASVYLVGLGPAAGGGYLAVFRLLAFIPQFQSSYVKEYHFLNPKLKKNCEIDYWNFQEDVSGFEKIFSKYDDQFLGQPRQKNEIQTLYFPLRSRSRKILATATLSSRSLAETLAILKEDIFLAFYSLLIISLLCCLIYLLMSFKSRRERGFSSVFLIAADLVGLRLLFFPFSRLERIQSLSIFSPAGAGFISVGGLTSSPADIFLTSTFVLVFVGCLMAYVLPGLKDSKKQKPRARLAVIALEIAALAVSVFIFHVFEEIIRRLIFNSNIPLLSFKSEWPFLLLHLSLLFFLAAALALVFLALRAAAVFSSGPARSLFFLAPALGADIFLSGTRFSPMAMTVKVAIIILILLSVYVPGKFKNKEALFAVFFLSCLFLTLTIDRVSNLRNRILIQNSLRNAVLSQEQWGRFLIEESLPEIENRSQAILSFLKEPGSPDFAHSIWERTMAARFNWYSSLEILDPDGNAVSRFSLNVPKIFGRELSLPRSRNWTVIRKTIPSLGRENDFLIGYKDWYQGDKELGRTILLFSLGPEMLPFLYSANPYFELLRAAPIPSMNAVAFRLAVYDMDGRLLFNPQNISSGVPADVLQNLKIHTAPVWEKIVDKSGPYSAFYFPHNNRILALLTPRKNLRNLAAKFLKVFFFDLLLILFMTLPLVLFFRRRFFKNVFWSFSNRVYAAFFAIALIPLVVFTFFTRGLLDRIVTERFVEEAASRAEFARSIMEDFVHIQQSEASGTQLISEDLVLWVGTTLSNDINLYKDARLLSSSRREFFDAGFLPRLIDGEIYYDLMFKKVPFSAQREKIGTFSFQTLTIPYRFGGSVFLISMPFPFEKQEAERATAELVEFIVFLSLFFAAMITVFSRGIRAMIVVPVRKLLEGTREVSLGNLKVNIEHAPHDEMKTLIEGFNTMVQSLNAHQQELAEMGKKVAWADMARKVAHEIKNPLTPIQLSAEHILKVFEDRRGDFETALRESVSYIISEVESLRKISQEFMEIARDTTLLKEDCDLKNILSETLEPYKKLLSTRITFMEVFEGNDFRYLGDTAKLKTAFRNIITNAIEAVQEKGKIKILARRNDGMFTIEIHDSGPGMEKDILNKIFEPYFSTKDAGTGLGLSIAKKIIEDHGGSIRMVSEPGQGSTVIIDLPLEA